MNKKIITVAAIVILCIGIVICGFVLAKNNANNDNSNNQIAANESVNTETTASFVQSPNIVFETSINKDKLIVSDETDVDNQSNYDQGATNKIYIDENLGNETVSGGNFVWR